MKHRRRLPKILLGVIAFVLLVSVAFGGFVWWKTAPPPRIDTVAALIEAREALQPEGEDAWPRYVALYRDTLGMKHFGDRDASDLSRLYFRAGSAEFVILLVGEWDDPRLDNAKSMLREAQPIFEALRYATDAPACRTPMLSHNTLLYAGPDMSFNVSDETSASPLDAYSAVGGFQFPYLHRLLLFEARDAFESGDCERLIDANRRMFTLAEHIGAAPFQSSLKRRVEAEIITYRNISLLALHGDMPTESVDAFLAMFDEPARDIPLRDYLLATVEVSANIDLRHFSREIRAPSELLQTSIDAFSYSSPREIAERRVREVQDAAEFVDLPTADLVSRGLPKDYLLAHEAFYISRAVKDRAAALCARAATRIILLLERHHAVTGEWPASLEDIMPREDTLDPNTLTPFVYTLTPDGPFPFSLSAPPEAAFVREEERDFTKPRPPFPVQSRGRQPPR